MHEMCKHQEAVPTRVLNEFYGRHEEHARLHLRYPRAKVFRDCCNLKLVTAYRATFGDDLKDTGTACMRAKNYDGSYSRAEKVALDAGIIVYPIQSADACLIAAYAMLKCSSMFKKQYWYHMGDVYGSIQEVSLFNI
jgi:hypothetical protein